MTVLIFPRGRFALLKAAQATLLVTALWLLSFSYRSEPSVRRSLLLPPPPPSSFYDAEYTRELRIPLPRNPKHEQPPRITPHPFVSGDYFRGMADFAWDEFDNQSKWNASSINNGAIIWVKGELSADFISQRHGDIQHPYVLVTHNADASNPREHSAVLDDPKLIAWYTVNADVDKPHPKLHAIPIGLANNQWPHGNIDEFNRFLSLPTPSQFDREILLFINVATYSNPERKVWVESFRNFPGAVIVDVEENPTLSHADFLASLKKARFVLSPPGNGIDCHRTWEAVAMGAIPIVLSSTIDSLYAKAPVLVVNDFREVTPELLATWRPKTWARDVMWGRYWWNHFQDSIAEFGKSGKESD
ncbi:hypothetical protein BDZ88DRAFT_315437 [Geranomyces variabilis]|nr:hypothetical protein BDZ88DRAFT_315437 [Geranomyces variabilis]KAJ3132666.1 hypothetical protein HDU90_006718 [Geranomyces variabilis]